MKFLIENSKSRTVIEMSFMKIKCRVHVVNVNRVYDNMYILILYI